jgi:antitoxin component YwqK of YwqJK toxin-antitoxin module
MGYLSFLALLAFNSRKNLANNYLLTESRASCEECKCYKENSQPKAEQGVERPNMRQKTECPELDPFNIKYPSGALSIDGKLKNRRLHGVRRSFYSDESPRSIDVFNSGTRDGTCESYFPNGDLKCDGVYKASLDCSVRVGEWRKYWEDSGETIREIERFNSSGKKHGDFEFYNRHGNLVKRVTYSNDEETSREEY